MEKESNVQGIYGLLNEFCAYYWQMNNDIAMYDYCKTHADGIKAWKAYMNRGANWRLAYAEFKYYMLHYLYYAKEHHPDVYQGIMANKEFLAVYRDIESRFRERIDDFEKDLDQIWAMLEEQGYKIERYPADNYVYDDAGNLTIVDLYETDYSTLIKELEKDQYVQIHNELVK